MNAKRILALLIFAGFILPACRRASIPEEKIFRFIDHLEQEGVVESPLIEISGRTEETDKFYPAKSYPVRDMGSGQNPYGIKRKLNIRNADSNVLFAPPKSRYVFDIEIPDDAILEFGTGIVRDKNAEEILNLTGKKDITSTFTVLLEIDGYTKTIFQNTHDVLQDGCARFSRKSENLINDRRSTSEFLFLV
jgi:hypothetical protein